MSEKVETHLLTPPHILQAIGGDYGFDLDPAGTERALTAQRIYDIENGEDGLTLPWFGRVWLHPPYGATTKQFMKRMAEHHQGTALLAARPETKMFQRQVFGYATAALFIEGRPMMNTIIVTASGEVRSNWKEASVAQVLVAYGEEDAIALRRADIKGHFVWLDGAKRTGDRRLA